MDKQIQTLSQQTETTAHRLFDEYVQTIRNGKKDELFALERQCAERRLLEPDEHKRASLCRDEALIDIALAEEAIVDRGNAYFALRENENARDKLKIAERLEPLNGANKVVDDMLRTSYETSTYLPEFQIYYPGGFPIDSGYAQNYHQKQTTSRMHY